MIETVLQCNYRSYDPKLFGDRLTAIMQKKGYVDKKGQLDYRKLYNQLCDKEDIIPETFSGAYVNTKTRTIRNWTTGACLPRTIEDIIKLCNVFQVDMPYFFCADLNYETVNNEFICNETGLTESVLQHLYDLKQLSISKNKHISDITRQKIHVLNSFLSILMSGSRNTLLDNMYDLVSTLSRIKEIESSDIYNMSESEILNAQLEDPDRFKDSEGYESELHDLDKTSKASQFDLSRRLINEIEKIELR